MNLTEYQETMLKEYAKERDAALLSLDKEKIVAHSKKWGIKLPSSDLALWAGVHKAILFTNSATPEQRECSEAWLIKHGFPTTIERA